MKKMWRILLLAACLTGAVWAEDDSESTLFQPPPEEEAPAKPSKKPLKSEGPLPPPEKKSIALPEIKAQLISLDGKVVETGLTSANDLRQVSETLYRVAGYLCISDDTLPDYLFIEFPPEGKEFFEMLAKKDLWNSSRQKVYLLIRNKKVTAVGTRYNKSKNEYSW
jgi:hypothetical protein